MLNILLISLLLLKISLIQSVLCKSSYNLFISKISKFLSCIFDVEVSFGVIKSSIVTNWIKRSGTECVILPDKVMNSNYWKKMVD